MTEDVQMAKLPRSGFVLSQYIGNSWKVVFLARNRRFLLHEISAGIIEIGSLLPTNPFNKLFTPYRVILYLRGEPWGKIAA